MKRKTHKQKIGTILITIWNKFNRITRFIVSYISMLIIYITTVIPTGLAIKLLGKDLLQQRLNKDAPSYWIERLDPVNSMRNQF